MSLLVVYGRRSLPRRLPPAPPPPPRPVAYRPLHAQTQEHRFAPVQGQAVERHLATLVRAAVDRADLQHAALAQVGRGGDAPLLRGEVGHAAPGVAPAAEAAQPG